MKKIVSIITVLLLLLTPTLTASAMVEDGAYLLTYDEVTDLNDTSFALINEYDCFVLVYTDPTLGDYPTAKQAASDILQTYLANYAGPYEKGGVIFYVAMDTRDWQVYTTGDAWDIFNDDAMDEIEKRAVPQLSKGNYHKAFDSFLDVCEDALEANANGEDYARPKSTAFLFIALGIALIISFIIAIIWVSVLKSKLTIVAFEGDANRYRVADSFRIMASDDRFLYKTLNRIPRPKPSSSGGGSRGGSSGGGSRGGKF